MLWLSVAVQLHISSYTITVIYCRCPKTRFADIRVERGHRQNVKIDSEFLLVFHQFPSFLKLGNPETAKPIATVSSLWFM